MKSYTLHLTVRLLKMVVSGLIQKNLKNFTTAEKILLLLMPEIDMKVRSVDLKTQ